MEFAEAMTAHAERDLPRTPILAEVLEPYFAHWARLRAVLTEVWEPRASADPGLRAAIGHAMAFSTWRSLARDEGLGDDEAARLMCRLVACASEA